MSTNQLLVVVCCCVSLILNNAAISKGDTTPPNQQPRIISSDRLATDDSLKNLVILDIRTKAEYEAGHIAGAVNVPFKVPFSAWTTMQNELLLAIPEKDTLFQTIGGCGIGKDSQVVIVTQGMAEPPYPLANATRVADILIYAGIKNVGILDGGYAKWVAEKRPITTDVPQITPVPYQGQLDESMFVSIDYVKKRLDTKQSKFILIDARDTGVYDGSVVEPFANKAGHIPGAKSMPAPLMWNNDGTYKSVEILREIASGIIQGEDNEIILYCGVGGYAGAWYFVLTQMLEYKNVKIFEGSAQEWARHYDMVLD